MQVDFIPSSFSAALPQILICNEGMKTAVNITLLPPRYANIPSKVISLEKNECDHGFCIVRPKRRSILTYKGILVPGYACTSQIWQPLRDEIGTNYDLTLIDWPSQETLKYHQLSNFADWVVESFTLSQYDFIIGHSMGGLVALHLAAICKISIPKIILIETFLTPPSPFFQNLTLHESFLPTGETISHMLDREMQSYSISLRETLKNIDTRKQVKEFNQPLYALYGDRGTVISEMVVAALAWSEDLSSRFILEVIPNACHFPMIENVSATLRILKSIIEL